MNSFFKTATLLSLAGIASVASAVVQETVTLTNIPSYGAGAGGPEVRNQALTVTGYTLGRIQVDMTITQVDAADFASENKVRITAPSGQTTELSPFTTTSYSGTVTSSPLNTFFFTNVPVNTNNWAYSFRNSFQDADSGPDANVDTISFAFTDEAIAPPTSINLGNLVDPQADYANADMTASSSGGAVQWYRFTMTDTFNPRSGRYIDFDCLGGTSGRAIGIYNANGELQGSGSSTTATVKLLAGAETRRSATQNGNNWTPTITTGGLVPGTYYVAICGTTATFGTGFSVSTTSVDADPRTLEIRTNISEALNNAAPSNTDLGVASNPSSDYDTADYASADLALGLDDIRWFKINLPEAVTAAGGKFFDVDTLTTGTSVDTEIAVFNSNGECIGIDDDSSDGLESMLSWGDTTPRLVTGSTSLNATGQNGDLAAGDYYIAVAQYQTRFGTKFKAETLTTTPGGSAFLNIRTNVGTSGGGGISGVITLQNYIPGPGGRSVSFQITQASIPVGTGTATLDAGGAYSFTTSLPDGSYDLLVDASRSWLIKKASFTLTGGNATVNATLTNGDCNGNGIVDIADYTILSGAFSSLPGDGNYDARADLNEDGVIDIADYTILSGAFSATDDTP